MVPAAETARFREEMNALERAREQLASVILANDQEDNNFAAATVRGESEVAASSSTSQLAKAPDLARSGGEAKQGFEHQGEQSLTGHTPEAAASNSQLVRLQISPYTPLNSEFEKPVGPPPYRASTSGDWGPYATTMSNILQKIHPYDEGEISGQNSDEKTGGNILGGGNVLSNWLKKQKAAELLAKVTSREEQAPNVKNMFKLVQLAEFSSNHASSILAMVMKRSMFSDKIVAVKSLVLIHMLITAGNSDIPSAFYCHTDTLEEIIRNFSVKKGRRDYYPFLHSYASLLLDKIEFHHNFPSFEGTYSTEFRLAVPFAGGAEAAKALSLDALQSLQKLLNRALSCLEECQLLLSTLAKPQNKGLMKSNSFNQSTVRESDPENLVHSITVPILIEAELLHKACCHVMELLDLATSHLEISEADLETSKQEFAGQHAKLRQVFEDVRKDPAFLSRLVRPPKLEAELSCLAPPPLISTTSVSSRTWIWPDEINRVSSTNSTETTSAYTPQDLTLKNSASGLLLFPDATQSSGKKDDSSKAGSGNSNDGNSLMGHVFGGVGAAAEAALQKHAASRSGSGQSSPDGDKARSLTNSAHASPKIPTLQFPPAQPLPPALHFVPPLPPVKNNSAQNPVPLPLAIPKTVPWAQGAVNQQENLHQLHLRQLQVQQEAGQRYLKQQQERFELAQKVQKNAAQTLEQVRFADLLAQSPYKPEVFRVGTPLNKAAAKNKEARAQEQPAGAQPMAEIPPQKPQDFTGDAAGMDPGPRAADAAAAQAKSISIGAEWEIPFSELKLGPKIGQGAFGDVVLGSWQGTEVAVKRLQNMDESHYEQAIRDFKREAELVMKLRHPNVVLFMGACTDLERSGELCIVMEYAKNGSLYHVLRNANVQIDFALVVRWALEAAKGINYLHTRSPPIVHRDLKSVNLLVDQDWHIKVSDFGLAKTKASSFAHSQVGTWGWMAPEVLDKQPYDERADVYSFGIVLWELVTRDEPFKGMHPLQIMRAVDKGERPAMPESCPNPYRKLISDCWQKEPGRRPRFDEIIVRLAAMELAVQQKKALSLLGR